MNTIHFDFTGHKWGRAGSNYYKGRAFDRVRLLALALALICLWWFCFGWAQSGMAWQHTRFGYGYTPLAEWMWAIAFVYTTDEQ